MALACSRSLALYLCSQLVSPCPGRLSIALALRFFEGLLECDFLVVGNVLEEFLDEVDVREDHAAAAVTLKTDGVEGVTGRVSVLAVRMGRWERAAGGARSGCVKVPRRRRDGGGLVERSGAYPSSISWVRRSMYFSQRSPTTCITVSMRRAWSLEVEPYLAAGEAADRDNHFDCACGFELCRGYMRPVLFRRGATR
jgi:hypothetical protein